MTDWITVSGGAGVTQLVQDDELWLELDGYVDVAFFVDVASVSTTQPLSLVMETSPTYDESLFLPVAPPLVLDASSASATAKRLKTVRCPSTAPLARLLRWRISCPAGGWSLTFRIRAVPGRSRFFVPPDLSGCALWLRSDLGITKDASDFVSTWADQSGAARDATQAGPTDVQPKWVANVLNGFPTLRFDGNDKLATGAFSLGPLTVLMVATGQSGAGFFWARSTGAAVSDTLYGSTNSTIYVDRSGTISGKDYAALWGQFTGAKLLTVQFGGTHASHVLRVNGAEVATTDTFANDPGAAVVSNKLCIAARDDGLVAAACDVAEVVVYDTALASPELTQVEEYLRHRYLLF